jgi:hypothetical protein
MLDVHAIYTTIEMLIMSIIRSIWQSNLDWATI